MKYEHNKRDTVLEKTTLAIRHINTRDEIQIILAFASLSMFSYIFTTHNLELLAFITALAIGATVTHLSKPTFSQFIASAIIGIAVAAVTIDLLNKLSNIIT